MEPQSLLIFLCVVLTLCGAITQAEVVLASSAGGSVTLLNSYAVQIASKLDFAPVTGQAYFVGNQCNFDVEETDFPQGAIIFYARFGCDEGVPLSGFVKISSRIGAVVELYGSESAILYDGGPDSDPYDFPPRFLFDPRPAKQNMICMRVHGSSSGIAAHFLKANLNATVTAQVTFTPDPWKAMYYTPQWIIFETFAICFFAVYIPQHAIRALILIRRMRQKMPLSAKAHGFNLQTVMMAAAVALGCVRIVEYSTQTLRDYGDIWSPEIVSQLAWGYGYMILLMGMLLLVLFWSDVLKTSRVKLLMIERITWRFYVVFGVVAWAVLTTFIFLFVFEVPGTTYVRSAGFLLLGAVALLESVGTMIFGGRLLRQLKDVKPIAERGGSVIQRSPSLGTEKDAPFVTENPQFDPAMNSSGSKPSTSRFSLVKQLSSKTSNMNSDDSEEKRNIRVAQKRSKPLTRLVIISAVLLFVATLLSAAASFTTILNSPRTYIVIFMPLLAVEITIYSLIINTMSPIWQERRRRFARSESDAQLQALSEDGTVPVFAATTPSCGRSVVKFFRNWVVC